MCSRDDYGGVLSLFCVLRTQFFIDFFAVHTCLQQRNIYSAIITQTENNPLENQGDLCFQVFFLFES